MPELILHGCTPEPLMSYLKALGVLRLVAEQADPDARGAWRAGTFVLSSHLDEDALMKFFLEQYQPTPIVAPWGARSGFYPGSSESSARAALQAIQDAKSERLEPFQSVVRIVQEVLIDLGFTAKAKDEDKLTVMRACRARLPDHLLPWLDATYVLTQEDRKFPPLLGTGGNEGSGSYVSGFAQQVVSVLIQREWDHALGSALFRHLAKDVMSGQTPGHFSPGAAGGPNAGQGFVGGVATNPWDYLLALEGACLWACGLFRRLGANMAGMAAFPFTIPPSAVGYETLSFSDGKKPKQAKREIAEMWLPLWEKPASLIEVQHLLAEGRATVKTRSARTGVEFARAVAGLGIDRGIASFQRLAFLMRNGQNFLATPIGRFTVHERREVGLLQEIDDWLEQFRRACQKNTTPPRFSAALRRIEAAIFDFCRYGGKLRMAEILCTLGNAEQQLANGEHFRKTTKPTIQPVPPLSPLWLSACDDGSTEFRLALALASICGDRDSRVGDLRTNLEPVEHKRARWTWAETSGGVVWSGADLCRNLAAVLTRRVMDAGRAGLGVLPLSSRFSTSLTDVATFLAGDTDDQRLEELLWGLLLIDGANEWREQREQLTKPSERPLLIPSAYALLKLVFLPHRLSWPVGAEGVSIKPEPDILGRLRAGNVQGAGEIAARRLRASGFAPMPGPLSDGRRRELDLDARVDPTRLAAALLVPVSGTAQLARLVLRLRTESPTEATI
ncbi:MAG: type I-U CRISPR-associated protein Csx17 [Deltaproteobacteria bacterium]|nr:type I-U CRISPR-associated protein Csx17 [Deltaproteobacteria bacterium]